MVGSLSFPHVCEGEALGVMSCGAGRTLDSPDSGLPPSPSPGAWLLPGTVERAGGQGSEDESRVPFGAARPLQKLQPLSFKNSIFLEPLPPKEIRYTTTVHYDSKRLFTESVYLSERVQVLQKCRQTVVAVPNSTWRHYKTELEFQPLHRPQTFTSSTVIYPKTTRAVFTTKLSYDIYRRARHYLSSVELKPTDGGQLPQ